MHYGLLVKVLLLLNVYAFGLYGVDKSRAKKDQWRIPEARLLWAAGLGGSVSALLGMYVFHHKTRKRAFAWGVPAMLAAQILLIVVLTQMGIIYP